MSFVTSTPHLSCHICGAQQLRLFSHYDNLPRVASDCVPWRAGGRLGVCQHCFCIQNPVDAQWHAETSQIYGQYQIYRQSAGSEQGVFAEGKQLVPRSAKIFQQAKPYFDLEKPGRLLDIGCANGELLRCFGLLAPHWKLSGFEIDDKRKEEVEQIPGVEKFASGSLDKLKTRFDIITLIHVLEHLPNPVQWLKDLHRLLTPTGYVLIQVPDPQQNPYNLLVADHCSHFVMPDLIRIAEEAGYHVIVCSDKWVSREFSLLITPAPAASLHTYLEKDFSPYVQRTETYPTHALQWLYEIVKQTQSLPNNTQRGIWGTAIAATWAYAVMNQQVDFFVDEDLHRIGQYHLGKPVYSPENIPADSDVFIALTPEIASNIYKRWSHLPARLHAPPQLQY